MSIKRFVAADMRRALELVREEMGPDAIILSSRRVKQGVEILSSLEADGAANVKAPAEPFISATEMPLVSDSDESCQQAIKELLDAGDIQAATDIAKKSTVVKARREKSTDRQTSFLAQELEKAQAQMLANQSLAAAKAKLSQRPRNRSLEVRGEVVGGERQPEPISTPLAAAPAAVEPAPLSYEAKASAEAVAKAEARAEAKAKAAAEAEKQRAEQNRQMELLQTELADMRLLLEEQLNQVAMPAHGSAINRTPFQQRLARRLQNLGCTEASINAVLGRVRPTRSMQAAWCDAQSQLAQLLPIAANDPVAEGGVFAFVGATGVGKSTTIAKLAARHVLEHGPHSVTLVTTDSARIAGHEQMRALGRILGVQVKVVEDIEDLPLLVRRLRNCSLVLIDTAGYRYGDPDLRMQLEVLADIPEIQTYLVCAANTQLQMIKASFHAHAGEDIHGCILTKIDETASLGEALSVIIEHQLPLYYTTNGQEIPADISQADSRKLVVRAARLANAHSEIEEPEDVEEIEQLQQQLSSVSLAVH